MKICMITPEFAPAIGGISTYVSNLTEYLQQNENTKVDVITFTPAQKRNYIIKNKLFFAIKSYFRLLEIKPNVIHSHSQWYALVPAILYKCFNKKVVSIHTFHTDAAYDIPGFKRLVFEWLLSKCNAVTFASFYLMNKMSHKIIINSRKEVIYSGVNKLKVDKKDVIIFKEKFKLDNNWPTICFIGNLSWELKTKGVEKLIEAFPNILKRYGNMKLLIVGDGKYKNNIEQLIHELNVEKNVILTGSLTNVFIPLSVADIYTHISLQEGGVSISILEAMSMCKPIIASRIGGIPELIVDGQNGILVEPTPQEIAGAIIELLEDEQKMKRIGEIAKLTVVEDYDWNKIVNKFMALYKNN